MQRTGVAYVSARNSYQLKISWPVSLEEARRFFLLDFVQDWLEEVDLHLDETRNGCEILEGILQRHHLSAPAIEREFSPRESLACRMLIHCLQDPPPCGLDSSPGLLRTFILPRPLISPGKVQILAEPPVSEVALD